MKATKRIKPDGGDVRSLYLPYCGIVPRFTVTSGLRVLWISQLGTLRIEFCLGRRHPRVDNARVLKRKLGGFECGNMSAKHDNSSSEINFARLLIESQV